MSVLTFSICLAPGAHALSLTGATYYTTNGAGAYAGSSFWDTLPVNGAYNLYFFSGAALLNDDATGEDATLNVPLAPGTYNLTFRYSDDRGTSGMNLYFNGSTSPAISVFAPSNAAANAFGVTPAGTNTYPLGSGASNAPGTATFVESGTGATVTVLEFSHTQGTTDLVGPTSPTADGGSDGFGTLTLQVTNPVPEPASLAALGLGAIALLRRRKRA